MDPHRRRSRNGLVIVLAWLIAVIVGVSLWVGLYLILAHFFGWVGSLFAIAIIILVIIGGIWVWSEINRHKQN